MIGHAAALLNLDRCSAERAQKAVECLARGSKPGDVENTITKALGILQENGVYACFLYLKAKEERKGDILVDEMLGLLQTMDDGLGLGWGKPDKTDSNGILNYVGNKVAARLEPLLLAKETLEQMLIYARYGAKALRSRQS